jgi:transcriptional regulator with XRE-family HTH domain
MARPVVGVCLICYTDKFRHNPTQCNNFFFMSYRLSQKESAMDWKSVAKQVKLARTRRNMTQDDLATATGKHRATIARLEGGNSIGEGTLYAIADCLKVEYSTLTGETGSLGGPPNPLDENASSRGDVMDHLLSQAKDLADFICGWEAMSASGITLGQLSKAIDYAHRVQDSVDALNALGIKGPEDLPLMAPMNGGQG